MDRTWDVISVGEPMVEFSEIPGEAPRFLQGFGGDTMNAVIAAARQGARAAYITRLGDDEFGRLLRDLWVRENVDASGVATDADAPTALYFITHGPGGHVFSYRRAGSAASGLSPANLPVDLIRRARFLHTSGISQAISASACDAVLTAIDAARSHDVRVVYDSNYRPRLWPLARARALIGATAGLADYFLPSLEDARALSGLESPDAILDWALALGARNVVLKMGPDGVVATDGSTRRRVAAPAIDCVDATGAGDCFAGAFIARLSAGDGFWDAIAWANVAAALTCTGYGAVQPIPREADVRRHVAGALPAPDV